MSELFRAWLSSELDRRKWSQRKLARQAGLSQSFVTQVLAGRHSPSVNFCVKVAQVFDVSPIYLLQLADILPDTPDLTGSDLGPITNEILELIQDMSPDAKRQVLDFIRFLKRGD